MCGICGIASRDVRRVPLDEPELRGMTNAIRHRGPDDEGIYRSEGVALGMRRLSVIDPAHSPQPVFSEDRRVVAVFNGEIYNFRALREALVSSGHRLVTNGDSETIVHLYEEHGPDFVRHLKGMFGIAVWDEPRRRLVLARDRFGIKPLYYTVGPSGLAFASEVKSLVAGGLVDPKLDLRAAELFMAYGFVPAPYTLFEGVRKLMPASLMVWEDGRLVEEREYWRPLDDAPERQGTTWRDDQEQLLGLLRDSVRAEMVSDVPLGVMLSGGLDSSLITALMVESGGGPVKTFSVGFAEDGAANELGDARRVANRLGTDHHEMLTSAVDHPALLDEALWHLEEPVADISQLGFLLLSRLARESVTVALSGQGADELLGGYRKHQIATVAGLLARAPDGLGSLVTALGRRAPAGSTLGRGLVALGTRDPVERILTMSRVVQSHERGETFTPGFLQPDAEELIADVARSHLLDDGGTPLTTTLRLDTRLALADNMLLYFDKASMATSLEVRVPFLDPRLAGFCFGLPDSRRVWALRRKEVLKRASRGLVDETIIKKKKRGFFHAALGVWLREHREAVLHDTLLDARTRERGQYSPELVRSLLAAAGEDGKKADQRLFSLLLLEKWQRLWVDSDGSARREALAAQHAASAQLAAA